jgi:hypothetical protein
LSDFAYAIKAGKEGLKPGAIILPNNRWNSNCNPIFARKNQRIKTLFANCYTNSFNLRRVCVELH